MTTPSIPELMKLARDFEKQWDPLLRDLAKRLENLEDEAFSPQASSGEFLLWCVTHDRRLDACEHLEADCCVVGANQDPGSPVSDPTGATALAWGNPKRSDLKQVGRQLESLLRIVGHIDLLTAMPQTVDGATLAMKGRKAATENAKGGGCTICAKSGKYVPPHQPEKGRTIGPTTIGGRLDEEVVPCSWHFAFVRTNNRLPNDTEEAQHQAGKRVIVRAGGIGVQTSRLIDGIETGRLGA